MKEISFSNFETELNELIPGSAAELVNSVIDRYNVADVIKVLLAGMHHAHDALGNFKLYERVNDIYGIGRSNCTIANMHTNMAADSILIAPNNNDFTTDAFPETQGILIGIKGGNYDVNKSLWIFIGSSIYIRTNSSEWDNCLGSYTSQTIDVSSISAIGSCGLRTVVRGHVVNFSLYVDMASAATNETFSLGQIMPATPFGCKCVGGRNNAYDYGTNIMHVTPNGTTYIGGTFIADARYTFSGSYIIS